MLRLLPVLIVAVTNLHAPVANACSCLKEQWAEILPNRNALPPTNTVVFAYVSQRLLEPRQSQPTIILGRQPKQRRLAKSPVVPVPPPAAQLETLAELVEADSGTPVPTSLETRQQGERQLLILTPQKELRPSTTYRVNIGTSMGGVLFETFTTGSGPDHTAPAWTGIRQAAYLKDVDVWSNCDTQEPYIDIEVDMPVDDSPSRGGPLYWTTNAASPVMRRSALSDQLLAIWIVENEGSIDYNEPPTMIQPVAAGQILSLGNSSICTRVSKSLSAEAKWIRVGIRPLDSAGNAGAISEALFEAKPGAPAELVR